MRMSDWSSDVCSSDRGKVFIAISHRGEVETHEGWLSAKEARKARAQAAKADASEADREAAKNARPEVTGSLQTYIDLHRHAATRAVLTDHPGVALRPKIGRASGRERGWKDG